MKLAEDDRGALCHCGRFFSRSGLVNHLQHIFGLPQGPMEYKAPRHTEQGVVFTKVTTDWGSCPRVWTFEKNNTYVPFAISKKGKFTRYFQVVKQLNIQRDV